MYMIPGDAVVKHSEPIPLFRLEEPIQPTPSIDVWGEQKFSLMATLGEMPDLARNEVTVGKWRLARAMGSLRGTQKSASSPWGEK